MSRQFHHKYVQPKVEKSMFHFIRLISYVSKIHFLFNQSYFHYYLLSWIFFDLIGHIEFQFFIRFYFIFYVYRSKFNSMYSVSFIYSNLISHSKSSYWSFSIPINDYVLLYYFTFTTRKFISFMPFHSFLYF